MSIQDLKNAMELLEKYEWPGNVRELQNIIERAVALCSETVIETNDIAEKVRNFISRPPESVMELTEEGIDLEDQTERIEKSLISLSPSLLSNPSLTA